MELQEEFVAGLSAHWQTHLAGVGAVDCTDGVLRLSKERTTAQTYSNAQIDDYQGRTRRNFLWRPPLTLTVCARFSHSAAALTGTAGFGFWNDPFLMTPGTRLPSLPRAIWFFYSSPPSNMQLARHVPGCGWKAATIDAWRAPFLLLAPTAPVAIPLMRIGALYRRLWPIAQRAIYVSEALIPHSMTEWRTYCIEWGETTARFRIDGETVLHCTTPPRGPLGLVIWIDNQYMVVTPWGAFRSGLVASAQREWMEIERIRVSGVDGRPRTNDEHG